MAATPSRVIQVSPSVERDEVTSCAWLLLPPSKGTAAPAALEEDAADVEGVPVVGGMTTAEVGAASVDGGGVVLSLDSTASEVGGAAVSVDGAAGGGGGGGGFDVLEVGGCVLGRLEVGGEEVVGPGQKMMQMSSRASAAAALRPVVIDEKATSTRAIASAVSTNRSRPRRCLRRTVTADLP